MAQGHNTRMGGEDEDTESLAARIFNLEKKTDAFNFHINFASSLMAEDGKHGEWDTRFICRDLRLDIKGDITPRVFYRLRHQFNMSQTAKGLDRFAKATDIMMVATAQAARWKSLLASCARYGADLSMTRTRWKFTVTATWSR